MSRTSTCGPSSKASPRGELSVNRYDTHPNPEAHGLAAAAIESFIERETAVDR